MNLPSLGYAAANEFLTIFLARLQLSFCPAFKSSGAPRSYHAILSRFIVSAFNRSMVRGSSSSEYIASNIAASVFPLIED